MPDPSAVSRNNIDQLRDTREHAIQFRHSSASHWANTLRYGRSDARPKHVKAVLFAVGMNLDIHRQARLDMLTLKWYEYSHPCTDQPIWII